MYLVDLTKGVCKQYPGLISNCTKAWGRASSKMASPSCDHRLHALYSIVFARFALCPGHNKPYKRCNQVRSLFRFDYQWTSFVYFLWSRGLLAGYPCFSTDVYNVRYNNIYIDLQILIILVYNVSNKNDDKLSNVDE